MNLDDQRRLITVREFNTIQAVGPDLLGEFGLVHDVKPELLEELRLVRQREDAPDPEHDRLGDARLHQLRPDPAAHLPLAYGEGAHLRQVLPEHMQGRAGGHLAGECPVVPGSAAVAGQGLREVGQGQHLPSPVARSDAERLRGRGAWNPFPGTASST
jgi:hypothetical protein